MNADNAFAETAVRHGRLATARLEEARVEFQRLVQYGVRLTLREVLLARGWLRLEDLAFLQRAQEFDGIRAEDQELARLAVDQAFASPAQVGAALAVQAAAFGQAPAVPRLVQLLQDAQVLDGQQALKLNALQRKLRAAGPPPLPAEPPPQTPAPAPAVPAAPATTAPVDSPRKVPAAAAGNLDLAALAASVGTVKPGSEQDSIPTAADLRSEIAPEGTSARGPSGSSLGALASSVGPARPGAEQDSIPTLGSFEPPAWLRTGSILPRDAAVRLDPKPDDAGEEEESDESGKGGAAK